MALDDTVQDTPEKFVIKKSETDEFVFAVLRLNSPNYDRIDKKIKTEINLYSNVVHLHEYTYLGYIYKSDLASERIAFIQKMQRAIITSIQEEQSEQTLQLATHIFPTSLDPRITLLPTTNYIFKLLFEGLVDLDSKGNIQNKVAESYTLSPDGTQYTFTLRESYWNNGDLVTAYDFEYSWKKILSPSFEFPFSYLFYLIKNASEAKNGKAPLSSVGIEVIDPKTLVVTLKEPAPHFLHYLTLTIFLPVNCRIDQQHPDWSFHTNGEYVCNGPFTLGKVVMGKDLLLVKNELHWNHFHVRLSKINLTFIPSNEILKQFQKNEIHLLGAPFHPGRSGFFNVKNRSIPSLPHP